MVLFCPKIEILSSHILSLISTPSPQCLAKMTVNFQNSLSIHDSAGEVANSTGTDSCNLQQYCDTGCQTDIMGEVGDTAAPPCLLSPLKTGFQTVTKS